MGTYDQLAQLVTWIGRSTGVTVTRYPPTGSLARHLRTLFQRLGTDCILDIGAHTGGYVRLLRRDVAFRGSIISFEPATASFLELSQAFEGDPKWRGHRYALGRVPGSAALHVFAGGGNLNSFLSPSSYGVAWAPQSLSSLTEELVEVRTLADVFDDVIGHLTNPRVHLKIDAQGFDLEVIEGTVPVLDRISSMQTEVSLKPIYDGQPVLEDVVPRLRELGFEVTGVFPVARDRDGLRLIETDCVLVRKPERSHSSSSSRSG
jgi:FkbM family methyltransferase